MMNTEIEADDTHSELRDRARDSMTLWHRLIGRIVKDGKAAGTFVADLYLVRARIDDHRRGRGRGDALATLRRSRTHGSRRRPPARARRVASRRTDNHDPSHRIPAERGSALPHRHLDRPGTCALPSARSRRSSARRIKRGGTLLPRPWPRSLGLCLEEFERGRTVFSVVAEELHENPMGTMHGGIVATPVDTAMGCVVLSTLAVAEGFTTLELSTNFVRAITQSTGRVYAEGRVIHRGGRFVTTEPASTTTRERRTWT